MNDLSEIDKGAIERLQKFGTMHASRYSTLWERFLANILDSIVMALLFVPVGLYVYYFRSPSLSIMQVIQVVSDFAPYLYAILCNGLYGRTIGKRIMGLKVIDESEEREIGFKQAFFRDSIPIAALVFVLLVSIVEYRNVEPLNGSPLDIMEGWISLIWFATELLTAAFDKRRRALHDFLAGTVVVKL